MGTITNTKAYQAEIGTNKQKAVQGATNIEQLNEMVVEVEGKWKTRRRHKKHAKKKGNYKEINTQ